MSQVSQYYRCGRYVACHRVCTGSAEHQVRQRWTRRDHTIAIGASRGTETYPSHSRALVEEMNELERGPVGFGGVQKCTQGYSFELQISCRGPA
jgi:hypothetical protein